MRPPLHRRSARSGRIVGKLIVLLGLVAIVCGLLWYLSAQTRRQQECADGLRKIYRALEQYEVERGTLPTLAYFPDDPQGDTDSLRVVLENYGADTSACVCPSVHPVLRDLHLTYIWNIALNGSRLVKSDQPRWMLVEMTAISSDLPAPHFSRYNVLYTDGSVKQSSAPLNELPGL